MTLGRWTTLHDSIRRLTAIALVPLAAAGVVLAGCSDDAPVARTKEAAADTQAFDYDYVIETGTQARIDAGESIEVVPAELVVHVGESIRIVNEDVVDHTVGAFFVAAGETLTQEFRSAGTLEGTCTVHPSGRFVLRVLE